MRATLILSFVMLLLAGCERTPPARDQGDQQKLAMQYASEVILADPEAVWDGAGRFPGWENRLGLATEGLLPPVAATFGKPDRLDRRVDVAKFYAQLVGHLDNTKPLSAHLTLTRPEENRVGPDQTIKAVYALIRLSLERGDINQARAQSEMLPDPRARAIIGFLCDGLYASAVDAIIETRAYMEIPHLVSGQWLTRIIPFQSSSATPRSAFNSSNVNAFLSAASWPSRSTASAGLF